MKIKLILAWIIIGISCFFAGFGVGKFLMEFIIFVMTMITTAELITMFIIIAIIWAIVYLVNYYKIGQDI